MQHEPTFFVHGEWTPALQSRGKAVTTAWTGP
jgi:hypothetical protein